MFEVWLFCYFDQTLDTFCLIISSNQKCVDGKLFQIKEEV